MLVYSQVCVCVCVCVSSYYVYSTYIHMYVCSEDKTTPKPRGMGLWPVAWREQHHATPWHGRSAAKECAHTPKHPLCAGSRPGNDSLAVGAAACAGGLGTLIVDARHTLAVVAPAPDARARQCTRAGATAGGAAKCCRATAPETGTRRGGTQTTGKVNTTQHRGTQTHTARDQLHAPPSPVARPRQPRRTAPRQAATIAEWVVFRSVQRGFDLQPLCSKLGTISRFRSER